MPLNLWEDDDERKRQLVGLNPTPTDMVRERLMSAPPVSMEEPKVITPSIPAVEIPSFDEEPKRTTGQDIGLLLGQMASGLGDAYARSFGGQNTTYLSNLSEAEKNERIQEREGREQKQKELQAWLEGKKAKREEEKYEFDKQKNELEAMRQSGKQTFEMEEKLRDGFVKATNTFSTVRDQYGVIRAVAKDTSGAGDIALIFAFMKMVDPGSSVKEGEFATAENAPGVPERLRGKYNRFVSGEHFTPQTRLDFVRQAENMFNSYKVNFEKTKEMYNNLADAYNLDKKRVTEIVPIGSIDIEDKQQILTATNPSTGEKIESRDGGKTWEPVKK
jgi:hypothetical protein